MGQARRPAPPGYCVLEVDAGLQFENAVARIDRARDIAIGRRDLAEARRRSVGAGQEVRHVENVQSAGADAHIDALVDLDSFGKAEIEVALPRQVQVALPAELAG